VALRAAANQRFSGEQGHISEQTGWISFAIFHPWHLFFDKGSRSFGKNIDNISTS
jgi:hypothetical protein